MGKKSVRKPDMVRWLFVQSGEGGGDNLKVLPRSYDQPP